MKLLENLKRSSLRQLSLVKAGLNEFTIPCLVEILQTHKRLAYLDISWNQVIPKSMKRILEVISTNRRLSNINLSFNTLTDQQTPEKDQKDIIGYLSKVIKHNK